MASLIGEAAAAASARENALRLRARGTYLIGAGGGGVQEIGEERGLIEDTWAKWDEKWAVLGGDGDLAFGME